MRQHTYVLCNKQCREQAADSHEALLLTWAFPCYRFNLTLVHTADAVKVRGKKGCGGR